MTRDSITTSLDAVLGNRDGPDPEFIRGRLTDVTFDLSASLFDQLVNHEEFPCELSIYLRVSVHGVDSHEKQPPKVVY